MKRTGKKLQGIIPAIVTPIDEDGKLNLKLLEKQAGYLLDGGVQGLFACGGTGEGAYLKTEEKSHSCEWLFASVAGHLHALAHFFQAVGQLVDQLHFDIEVDGQEIGRASCRERV